MFSKRFLSCVLLAAASSFLMSCGGDTDSDENGIFVPPAINYAPSIDNATLIVQDSAREIEIAQEYQRTVLMSDPNPGDVLTLHASPPLSIANDSVLTWTPTAAGEYHFWIYVTDSAGLSSDTVFWTMRIYDKSQSHPRLEIFLANPQGVIHPKLFNCNLVGRLYLRTDTDTTFIEQKVMGPVVEDFNFEFDATVDTGSFVIVDYWFEKDTTGAAMDTLYAAPPAEATQWLEYPEPSGRWSWGPIVYDANGGHGVQHRMGDMTSKLFDLSKFSQTPLAP